MFNALKIMTDISAVADGWSIVGGSGMPEPDGETVVNVQRVTLAYQVEKKDITAEVLSYYQTTASWSDTEIKAKMIPTAFFSLSAGTWNNGGFSFDESGKTMVCKLVLELRAS